ncbi:hypothetical protein [Micromonospora mirobrigensis]|uniref:Uncharacterized protein n=1 Tax=Micromonospora mirobrigensis TaxID=262898 RepID=A0A1C4ZRI1_9ACTN|nr:hypothetical protein [Micromonospora mirobrigensis]SCF35519.1 hypothetical protein GA0070564_106219 [Micromonospora mirobrigensis]
MTDLPAGHVTTTAPPRALRVLVTAVASLVVGPVLLLYGWVLAWFSPEITGAGRCPGGVDDGALVWSVAASTTVAALLCFAVALVRLHRGGRWWPWLAAALVFLAVGFPVLSGVPSAAWCPPAS